MKPRRIILIITFTVIIALTPIIFIAEPTSKTFNICMGVFCSGIIAFVIELPNYLYIKENTKKQIYSIPLQIYTKLLLYKTTINDHKNGKYMITQGLGQINYDEVDNLVTIFEQIDNNYFIKKELFIRHKQCFNNLRNTLNILHLKLQTSIAKLNSEKSENRQTKIISPLEIEEELSNIINSINDFVCYLNLFASDIFNKKQFKTWQIETTNTLAILKQFQ